MGKKLFIIVMCLVLLFFVGMIACCIALNHNITTLWSFDLASINTICLWTWIILFAADVIGALVHSIKEGYAVYKRYR